MIFHTVLFTWVDGVTDEQVASLEADLRADVANFPGITFYACGVDLGLDANPDAFGIIAGAETVDDLKTYLNDEGHKAIAGKWKSLVATRHIAEFSSEKYLNN